MTQLATSAPPIRTPFFYGWVIVAMLMVATGIAAFSSQNITSLMVQPMLRDTGWSRTEFSAALTVAGLAGTVLAPLAGFFVDRYGPRVLLPAGALAMSAGLLVLSRMTTLPELYLSYMVVRGVGPVAMSGAVVQTTVVNWFVRMRGRAAGITALSWQLFVSSFALVTSGLMQAYGWRSVFSVLGVAAAVGALPMALLLRRRPEDVGLLPDGDAAPVATRGAPSSPQAPGFTLREALRTRALWFMAAAQFCGSLAVQSASFHWAPRYAEVGIDVIMVASMISAYGLASALSTGVWGFLAERFPERSLAIITQCCGFCLVLVMMVGAHLVVAFAAVILFGLTSRGENSMFGLVLARFYGRRSYGKIAGIVHPCGTVGASLAPLLGGVVADVTGSYAPLYGVLACVYLLSIGCLLLARQPARPSARPNAC